MNRETPDRDAALLERFSRYVCDEFWLRLRGPEAHINAKSIHRLSIMISDRSDAPYTALGVHMYPAGSDRFVDRSGRPSRRKIAELIRDALLEVADEQGLSKQRIKTAFEAFDFSVPYYQQTWHLKVQKVRKEYPQLAALTRVYADAAYVLAEVSDERRPRFCFLARAEGGLSVWGSKLGHFVWRGPDQFCLMDRSKKEVACRHLSDGAGSIEQLIQ